MFCVNCGEKLNEGEMVCHKCGASQVPASGESPINNQVNNEPVNNPEPVQNAVSEPVNNTPVANPTVASTPANNAVTPQANKGGNKWLVPVLIVIILALVGVVIFFLLDKNNSGKNPGIQDQ